MKHITLLLVLLIVSACSGGKYSQPRNLDNACSMKRQHPGMFKHLDKASKKWNVPGPVFLAMIHQESKFIHNARPPHRYFLGIIPSGRQSSALGYSQALDGTWKEYKRETGRSGAKRTSFKHSLDFMGWYMTKTQKRNGIPKFDAYNQYLAYHEGHTGFARRSYTRKRWLPPVARKVQSRAVMYDIQLASCR